MSIASVLQLDNLLEENYLNINTIHICEILNDTHIEKILNCVNIIYLHIYSTHEQICENGSKFAIFNKIQYLYIYHEGCINNLINPIIMNKTNMLISYLEPHSYIINNDVTHLNIIDIKGSNFELLDRLPNQLEFLKTPYASGSPNFRNFPSSLKELIIIVNVFDFVLDDIKSNVILPFGCNLKIISEFTMRQTNKQLMCISHLLFESK